MWPFSAMMVRMCCCSSLLSLFPLLALSPHSPPSLPPHPLHHSLRSSPSLPLSSLPSPSLTRLPFPTGRLAASGSGDSSIKILDVDRMMSKTALGHQQDLHPVIRTLYDHTDVCKHKFQDFVYALIREIFMMGGAWCETA